MLNTIYSAGLAGIDGYVVAVECDAQERLPQFEIVGLPDKAVKEACERVRSVIGNMGYRFPECAITINLSPADKKKEGTGYDAAILLGVLQAGGILPRGLSFEGRCILGELSLSGKFRPVRGSLCMCLAAREAGMREFYITAENAREAAVVEGIDVFPVEDISALAAHLRGDRLIEPLKVDLNEINFNTAPGGIDFSEVCGQERAKRAFEIAAAGGHNILLIGPPGTGKSMLSKRLPTIMPPMTFDEAIEATKIHSVLGCLPPMTAVMTARPFRAPHHTMSAPSLVGGGAMPMPGEISLAHNGVLFLDELPEFNKMVTESLRQPLEDGTVTITRTGGRLTFPCGFMLVCAMNPCKCGYFGHPSQPCRCSTPDRKKYLSRISGPLLDRIDIHIEMPSLSYDDLSGGKDAESSAAIRERICAAREFSRERMRRQGFSGDAPACNARLSSGRLRRVCDLDNEARELLRAVFDQLGLSARSHDRLLRVARTIADLARSEGVGAAHIAEAVQLRSLDRGYWGK